jgi:hypothetical protein
MKRESIFAQMSELFSAYSGEVLTVSCETDGRIATLFPELDRPSMYRDADSWLLTCPKSRWPRNRRRFLLTWARREKTRALKASLAWAEKEAALRKESQIGARR